MRKISNFVILTCIVLSVLMVKLNAQQFIIENEKKIPVAFDVDVVVCGGGLTGTIAAIAAGQAGVKTLVIDRFGRFGGNVGPGMFAGGSVHYADDDDALINKEGPGGVVEEFKKRVIYARFNSNNITDDQRNELEEKHLNVPGLRMGSGGLGYEIESHTVSYVAFKMMEEAGIEMLLSAYVADPIMEGGKVSGVFVETKSGRLAVKAKIVIDATGEADIAFRAGAPTLIQMMPNMGLTYSIKGVNWEKYRG